MLSSGLDMIVLSAVFPARASALDEFGEDLSRAVVRARPIAVNCSLAADPKLLNGVREVAPA